MSYKFSKGERTFNDITSEDDADTKINFEADYIALETAGAAILVVSGSSVGVGVSDPDSTLEVAGTVHISGESSTPSSPGDGDGGILYAKTDGKLYWVSNELSETDLTATGGGGGGSSNAFNTISVSGQSDVVADSSTDTLTFITGSNVSITTDASNDKITINVGWSPKIIDGFQLTWINTTTVQVGIGDCRDVDNTNNISLTSVQNVDITSSGVNGLDTGSEATSTWYSVWVISGTSGTATLLSTSTASPTLPSGYTNKRRLGWVYNHSDGDIQSFMQTGPGRERILWWTESTNDYARPINGVSNNGSYATVDISDFVAPTAHHWISRLVVTYGGNSEVSIKSTDGPTIVFTRVQQSAAEYQIIDMPCPDNKSFQYQTTNPAKLQAIVFGWKETI